jgi:hypothetical protein
MWAVLKKLRRKSEAWMRYIPINVDVIACHFARRCWDIHTVARLCLWKRRLRVEAALSQRLSGTGEARFEAAEIIHLGESLPILLGRDTVAETVLERATWSIC